ncbi:MAG TPA: hypothetical protein VND93_00650 [Myxococcales bacterium]|nr:hypothetical protein [Myxococcales bacterium]
MLRRELAIALRSRVAWLQAALSALLVGHGFVLAVDLYSAASRSALGGSLMSRELDPLLGVVRPTLGGLYFAVSLLGPLAAARGFSVEKERRTFPSLLLQIGAATPVVLAKLAAAVAAVSLQLIAPAVLLLAWLVAGGHLHAGEVATSLLGHLLYVALIGALGVAAAAWTRTFAQAATAAILLVAASWAIDASEGFAALAWLGRALDWSVTTHLQPMERGTLAVGAALWMAVAITGAAALAILGARSDLGKLRPALIAATLVAIAALGAAAHGVRRALDLTELHRMSLPPAAERGLRELPGPISLEVLLDRDDARRQQLESDILSKLRIARPDARVVYSLDERSEPSEAERDEGYGRILVTAGAGRRETYSTSRRELVSLIFEAAGRAPPDWSQPEYPGYPLVLGGARRTAITLLAYAALPLGLLALGLWLTTPRRRNPT